MSCVDPEICSRTDRQAHHNTPLPCRSGVKSRYTFFKNAVETDRQTDGYDRLLEVELAPSPAAEESQ